MRSSDIDNNTEHYVSSLQTSGQGSSGINNGHVGIPCNCNSLSRQEVLWTIVDYYLYGVVLKGNGYVEILKSNKT